MQIKMISLNSFQENGKVEMATYIVTFEITDLTRRSSFKQKLREICRYYCPIHEYAWAVMSESNSSEIRDNLTPFLATGDRIFVIRSGTEAAWRNAYGQENSDWLKKNL